MVVIIEYTLSIRLTNVYGTRFTSIYYTPCLAYIYKCADGIIRYKIYVINSTPSYDINIYKSEIKKQDVKAKIVFKLQYYDYTTANIIRCGNKITVYSIICTFM